MLKSIIGNFKSIIGSGILFKDCAICKTKKAPLARFLTNDVQSSERNSQICHVLDDGALIHRIKWPKKATYRDAANVYVQYVHQHYMDRAA